LPKDPLFEYDNTNESKYDAATGMLENNRWISHYYFSNKFMKSVVFHYFYLWQKNPKGFKQ